VVDGLRDVHLGGDHGALVVTRQVGLDEVAEVEPVDVVGAHHEHHPCP
jgi:hypothetical protein